LGAVEGAGAFLGLLPLSYRCDIREAFTFGSCSEVDEPEGARLGVTGAGRLFCTVLGLYGLISGLSSLLGRLFGGMVHIKGKGGVTSTVKVKGDVIVCSLFDISKKTISIISTIANPAMAKRCSHCVVHSNLERQFGSKLAGKKLRELLVDRS